jgi:hypothetical protein
MAKLKPSRDIWLIVASLSIACALLRHFGGSALTYTTFYALLVLSGIGITISLFLGRRQGEVNGNLFFATLAPLALIFVDLSNGWRIACLLVIALVALIEWRFQHARRDIG